MSIEKRIEAIAENLNFFEEAMEKYEYIIELGKHLVPLDAKYQTETHRVQGCQSTVWMHLHAQDNRLIIEADADALIVKGLVAIIIKIYSGASCQEIRSFNQELLEILGLDEIITPGRQNGVASMIKNIWNYCSEKV